MNILWILGDDLGPELSCYGYPAARTPNLDKLASQGVRYTNAFVTGPVCSASRSALFTGMYQTSINCQHHRSMVTLPENVKPVSHLFQGGGYLTVINAKTDFNFRYDKTDANDFKSRKPNQPFFAQYSFIEPHRKGGKAAYEDTFAYTRNIDDPTDPAKVTVPPYYPDTAVTRKDIAGYLDALRLLDRKVGALLQRLDEEKLADNTIVIFLGDNGICMPRGKQFLYDGGIHIPLIVRWPGVTQPGTVDDRLVSAIDITATSLAAAGVPRPANMEGKVFLGPDADAPRDYIVAARDRCDETVDRIRCVRTKQFKYIRNFMPDRAYTQPNNYKERSYPILAELRAWKKEGKLSPAQQPFMADARPPEELYDIQSDPNELNNLAADPARASTVKQLRQTLDDWIKTTGDKGQLPEEPANVRK
jgi:arylsulfatase A-like enzyme